MIKNKMSVKKDKKIKIKSKIKKFDYKKVYNLITKRFHIKLLCLSMAFILFLYVRYQQEFSKDYIAKLQILNVPSKLLIANNINENITITVRGFRDSKHEYPMEFSTYIDLTNAQLGSNMYKVNLSEEIDYKNMNIIITHQGQLMPISVVVVPICKKGGASNRKSPTTTQKPLTQFRLYLNGNKVISTRV